MAKLRFKFGIVVDVFHGFLDWGLDSELGYGMLWVWLVGLASPSVELPVLSSWALADPEGGGGLRGLQPTPLNFQKRRVNSVAIVISTVSTVSEQERNGQGRRDVGKSVHVRQAIMQLYA